jgi:putative membrane protein
LTVIALGFVVARFGLFAALVSAQGAAHAAVHSNQWLSNAIGIALVVLGTAVILGALHNHRSYVRALPAQDVPRASLPWLATFMAVAVAGIGFLLAIYLAIA